MRINDEFIYDGDGDKVDYYQLGEIISAAVKNGYCNVIITNYIFDNCRTIDCTGIVPDGMKLNLTIRSCHFITNFNPFTEKIDPWVIINDDIKKITNGR